MLWPVVMLCVFAILRFAHHALVDPLVPAAYRSGAAEVLTVALAVSAFLVADRLLRRHYWHGFLRKRRNRETPAVIQDIVTIVLLLLGAAFGFWWMGTLTFPVFFGTVVAVSGAAAFVASNALSPIILDLFSGVAINFDGSYRLGDWLTIYVQDPAGIFGHVVGITWRTTFLRLEDGTVMAIPNRLITSNPVINHAREPRTKEHTIEITLDNRLRSERVRNILLGEAHKAVRRNGFAELPVPEVVLSRLTESGVVYQIRFHADPLRAPPRQARSAMLLALTDAVQRLRLPFPSTQVEKVEAPDLERDDQREIIEGLLRVPLFRDALSAEQAATLAARCKPVEMPPGRVLMQQNDPALSVFIILEGAASVWITTAAGERRDVAVLAMGDIVGEMSLLTGAPRNASVSALTQLRVLEVTKRAVAELVAASPELLERFSRVLATRLHELQALSRSDMHDAPTQNDLLALMRRVFSFAFGTSQPERPRRAG